MGSSPLTRGKPPHRLGVGAGNGLIPAHAGKTFGDPSAAAFLRAHPRSRGENSAMPEPRALIAGSSPLTRGKPARTVWPGRRAGLIPAHAGKTSVYSISFTTPWAHPRSRGENSAPITIACVVGGSSPLTRGKRGINLHPSRLFGLIPAHAGKTSTSSTRPPYRRAHPRSRGENLPVLSALETTMGSSPLTRGKHRGLLPVLQGHGLIPAHAGKTRTRPR